MGLFTGPAAAAKGLGLLFSGQGLLPLALIPAGVGLVLSIGGIWLAMAFGEDLVAAIWPEPSGWLAHLFWAIFTWIISLFSAVASIFITPWLVMLVGFPLCDPLMAKADALLGGKAVSADFLTELRRTIVSSLAVIGIGLLGAIVLFALGLIPGLGFFTVAFATFVWTPLFLAFDSMDPSLGRRQLEWKQKKAVITGNFSTSVSLGLTGTLLLSVPLLNLLGLPVLALAGVIVVRDLEKAGKLPVGTARPETP
jgi:CysZ protein